MEMDESKKLDGVRLRTSVEKFKETEKKQNIHEREKRGNGR